MTSKFQEARNVKPKYSWNEIKYFWKSLYKYSRNQIFLKPNILEWPFAKVIARSSEIQTFQNAGNVFYFKSKSIQCAGFCGKLTERTVLGITVVLLKNQLNYSSFTANLIWLKLFDYYSVITHLANQTMYICMKSENVHKVRKIGVWYLSWLTNCTYVGRAFLPSIWSRPLVHIWIDIYFESFKQTMMIWFLSTITFLSQGTVLKMSKGKN